MEYDRFGALFSRDGEKIPPTDQQMNTGLQYLGKIHPSKELFNSLFYSFDWKDNWLYNNIKSAVDTLGIGVGSGIVTGLRDAIKVFSASNIKVVTGPTTLTIRDAGVIRVNMGATQSAFNIILPDPNSVEGTSLEFVFIRTDNVTSRSPNVVAAGSATIEGLNSYTLLPGTRCTLRSTLDGVWRIASSSRDGLLIGEVKIWSGTSLPPRYIPPDGRSLSRAVYTDLFALWGTRYGEGDTPGSTFAAPDSRGCAVVAADSQFGGTASGRLGGAIPGWRGGQSTVALVADEMPLHSHSGVTSEAGYHNHTGSTGRNGGHGHVSVTDAVGQHTHEAYTTVEGRHGHTGVSDAIGSHIHGARTDINGAHQHRNVPLYTPGGDIDRGIGNPSFFSLDNEGLTSANGEHAHGVIVDPSGVHQHNLSINPAGEHQHGVIMGPGGLHQHNVNVTPIGDHPHTISSDGAHTHLLSITGTGKNAPHTNVQPSFAWNMIIYAGV